MLCNECSLFRPTFRIILRACFSLNIARESMPLINLKRWQDFARPQLPNCSRFEWSNMFKTKLLHTTLSETSGILHSAYNLRRSWYARSESYILMHMGNDEAALKIYKRKQSSVSHPNQVCKRRCSHQSLLNSHTLHN